jgi:hypothetical protein
MESSIDKFASIQETSPGGEHFQRGPVATEELTYFHANWRRAMVAKAEEPTGQNSSGRAGP